MITQQSNAVVKIHRIMGLDTLRLVALLLVTWQHAASVLGLYTETQWRDISPGQTGVGIFCAISGYLAFHTTPRNLANWFMRRLLSIFPSYWIVTVLAFAMVMFLGSSKSVTMALFASQMLGLGYFTHGWELVNVVSWFISLILFCYLLSFAIRLSGYPTIAWLLVVIVTALVVATRMEVALSRHILAFALGALLSINNLKYAFILVALALILTGVLFDPQFFYSGLALFVLYLAINGYIYEPRVFRKAAAYSYEYFLVHGICLVAATKIISGSLIGIMVAITGALVAAVALSYFSQSVIVISRSFKKGYCNN